MKKALLLTLSICLAQLSLAQKTISKIERDFAVQYLQESKSALSEVLKGLNETQINYKPDEETWSVRECVEHIAIAEKNLLGMVMGSLEEPNENNQAEVAMSDEALIQLITSRNNKVKTRKELEPGIYSSYEEAFKSFTNQRRSNINFIKTTDKDLRSYYIKFPFGLIDAYQGILFMSGHTQRHTKQIKELIGSKDFPS